MTRLLTTLELKGVLDHDEAVAMRRELRDDEV